MGWDSPTVRTGVTWVRGRPNAAHSEKQLATQQLGSLALKEIMFPLKYILFNCLFRFATSKEYFLAFFWFDISKIWFTIPG
jgi:hypothetical protein